MNESAAKRESQISNALARLDKTIAELEIITPQHEGNLVSVLRDEPQLKGECDVEKREAKVPLATVIDSYSDRIYSVNTKINSMQRRLEL